MSSSARWLRAARESACARSRATSGGEGFAPPPATNARAAAPAPARVITRPPWPGSKPRTGADRTRIHEFVRALFWQIAADIGLFSGCDHPIPLLACRTCDVPGPLRCACCKRPRSPVIRSLKRQAPTFVIAAAVSLLAAGGATADPSVSSKQAEARQVLAQIQQLDANTERAI